MTIGFPRQSAVDPLYHYCSAQRWTHSQTLASNCRANAAWSSWSLTKSSSARELIDEQFPTRTDSASWSLEKSNSNGFLCWPSSTRLTCLCQSNISLEVVSPLGHDQWMNFGATSRIYLHHHSSNKYVLINKLIHHFSLESTQRPMTMIEDWRSLTFGVETFSEKDSIDIVEIMNKLVDINLYRIDCDGHSIVRNRGKGK